MHKRTPTKKKTLRTGKACISTYVGLDLYEELKATAHHEGRTLSNLLLQILRQSFAAKGD